MLVPFSWILGFAGDLPDTMIGYFFFRNACLKFLYWLP